MAFKRSAVRSRRFWRCRPGRPTKTERAGLPLISYGDYPSFGFFYPLKSGCSCGIIGSSNKKLQVWLMRIIEVKENKKQYLDLLLSADEQEDMIDRYLDQGKMFVLDEDGVKCECVVTDEGNGVLEIKNIATVPEFQRKGYAKALIDFLVQKYAEHYTILQVGTGDSPLTIPFYEKCGFVRSHSIPNFFTDHYDHPIFECGIRLVDMIYLQRKI